ncbi:MAG: YbhN family protein [Pelagibaca sp.]
MARFLRVGLQVTVAIGLLVLLWRVADGQTAVDHLVTAELPWLLAALVAVTGQLVLSAFRWRLTAAQLGLLLTRQQAVREYYLSQVVNQILPGGVLGDVGRAVRARAQAGLAISGQAVLFERLVGQVALVLFFAAAVLGTWAVPGGFDLPVSLQTPVFVTVTAVILTGIVLAIASPSLPTKMGTAISAFMANFQRAVWAREVRRRQVLLSIGTVVLNIAAFACCTAAVGVVLAPATAMVLVPLILFTMLIPITVSGWGLREGATAALLPLAGVTAAEGFAASVAFGLVVLLSALPGVLVAGFSTVTKPVSP